MRDLKTRNYELLWGTGAGKGTFILRRVNDDSTTLRCTGSDAIEFYNKLLRHYNISGDSFDTACSFYKYEPEEQDRADILLKRARANKRREALASYLLDYINEEKARKRSLDATKLIDAIEAFEGGCSLSGKHYKVTVQQTDYHGNITEE